MMYLTTLVANTTFLFYQMSNADKIQQINELKQQFKTLKATNNYYLSIPNKNDIT